MIDEIDFQENSKTVQRIQMLIIGRLLIIFVLLVAGWLWNSTDWRLTFDNQSQEFFIVFIFSVALMVVYFFTLKIVKHYDWQVRIQFFIDALLITSLVWRTGDLTSPYITLYIVLIGVAGSFLSGHEILTVAGLCVLLFSGLSISTIFSFISSYSAVPDISQKSQSNCLQTTR